MSKETEEEFKKLLFKEIHQQPNTYDIDTNELCNEVLTELKDQGFIISQWRPIEEAPKDGTPVLLLMSGEKPSVVQCYWDAYYAESGRGFDGEGDGWVIIHGEQLHLLCATKPTHFMPLPPSPEEEEKKAEAEKTEKEPPWGDFHDRDAGEWSSGSCNGPYQRGE